MTSRRLAVLKVILALILSVPALYYAYCIGLAFTGGENRLGTDPAQTLVLASGGWAIKALILSLAVTPLRQLSGLNALARLRRMIGLFALFYALLHFLAFQVFILGGEWGRLALEIRERPYITVGFLALVILVLLGLTSFNAAQRKLGRRWKRLHQLVYIAGVLAAVHVTWISRSDYGQAVLYGGLIALLLIYRLLRRQSAAVRRFSLNRKVPATAANIKKS